MARNSGNAIRDFFIAMGFDASDVTKGMKEIEKSFGKLNKSVEVKTKNNVKAQKKVTGEMKSQLALERAKFSLEKKIDQMKAKGVPVMGLHNSLRAKDIAKVNKANLEAEKMLHWYKLENDKGIAREARAQARVAKATKEKAEAEKSRLKSVTEANRVHEYQMKLMRRQRTIERRRGDYQERLKRIDRNVRFRVGDTSRLEGTPELARMRSLRSQAGNLSGTARSVADFNKLKNVMLDLTQAQTHLISKNNQLNKSMSKMQFTTKALSDSMRNMARSYLSVFAVVGGAGVMFSMGQELTALRASLLASTGDAESAAEAFDFISQTSQAMGLNMQTATRSFAQMGVAAKMAGMSGNDTKEIFLGMSEAAAAFQMSTVDQERAFRALTQMMNKGQVNSIAS